MVLGTTGDMAVDSQYELHVLYIPARSSRWCCRSYDWGWGMDVVVAPEPAEHSDEEQRQVQGFYESMHALFEGASSDVIICKTVAVFMASVMVKSTDWKRVIPGFMTHMDMGANAALVHHQREEKENSNGNET